MKHSLPSARRLIAAAGVACISLAAASCSSDSSAENQAADQESTAASADGEKGSGKEGKESEKKKDGLKVSVKDGAKNVDPSQPVTVKTTGKLKSVTMTNEMGVEVKEKLSKDAKTWSTAEDLGYNHTYSIVASDAAVSYTHLTLPTNREV